MSNVNWDYVTPLAEPDAVTAFLDAHEVKLPGAIVAWLGTNNAGIPEPDTFTAGKRAGNVFKCLLSYNKETDGTEDIYTFYPLLAQGSLYPLGLEGSGDAICYDMETGAFVLVCHETGDVDVIDTASCPGLFPKLEG